MNRTCTILKCILLLFWVSFILVGCGGGGGSSSDGGGGPAALTYSGLTSQASISPTNAEDITTEALLGATIGVSVLGNTDAGKNTKPIISHLYVIDLPKVLRRSTENVNWHPGKEIALSRVESDTINGECGGNLAYTITVDDATGNFSGTFTYSQFCDSGITITGTVDVDGTVDLVTNEFKTINFNFDNLTSDEFVMSGIISLDDTNTTLSLITLDFLFKDIALNKVYWINDYSMTVTEINATDTEIAITGVFYDPDYGYVNVSTPIPFIFISADDWPTLGTMLCEGVGNTKTILTAVDNQSYRIEADTNGDGVYDYNSGVLFWADL
jgi:hypothetical protein